LPFREGPLEDGDIDIGLVEIIIERLRRRESKVTPRFGLVVA
jgi:hypothetical protein